MADIFPLLLIITLSFALKFIYIMTPASSDLWSDLWQVKRRSKSRFGERQVGDTLVGKCRGYPSFPHYIISRFPERYWILTGRILNLLYDCFSLILVYFLSYILFHKIWNLEYHGFISPEIGVTLLSATSPILFPVTSRLTAMGGRTLGNLLNLLYFTLFGYAFLFGQPLFYLPVLILGILIILSSQFGLQNWLFTSLVISIFYLNPIPFISAIVALGIGAVIPGLGIKEILLSKINHYLWYSSPGGGTGAKDRNRLKDILYLPAYLVMKPRKFFGLIFTKITPVIAAYSMPVLVILIFWLVKSPQDIAVFTSEKIAFYLLSICLASFLAFIITSLKPFLFLGEAERYFEYSVFYVNLLFVYFILEKAIAFNIVFWLLLIQLIIIIVNFLFIKKNEFLREIGLEENYSFSALINFLQKQERLRILSIPTKINFKISAYLDNPGALFYYEFMSEKIDGLQYMKDDLAVYQFVRPDFSYFNNKYGINTLVVQKAALTGARERGINYGFDALNKLFENDQYLVYGLT